ncbi:xanthine dehydrogenase accessory protein XdhC [Alsobacter metallidurans]|uniref:Xanthine dehydrogenase accessory protein XdhC n=1 Tax=Alsobacter metallidurans TaxID=340221 RepID=A0A917I611_9HYPH|nr:xanthine dehydrogenase accessory protein XdhC [Alsobacter metallidurans]GGH14103.1 xanthine dehydrogenase accessory protein XdhC [Alsobacter metallidurans]
MTLIWTRLLETIDTQGSAALVSVVAVQGSAPREAGARMVVRPDGGFWGTVGGGELEWRLLRDAKATLGAEARSTLVGDWPLGPDLGQCCGGRVKTWVETFAREDRAEIARFAELEPGGPFHLDALLGPDGRIMRKVAVDAAQSVAVVRERYGEDRTPLLLFGAGHVGRALAQALAPLPFRLRWIDSREDAFPAIIPQNAEALVTADPVQAVANAPAGSLVMVMTHSHPLDLAVTAAALGRTDLGPVGLIGSATKRARFLARLRQAGVSEATLLRLNCPIGVEGVSGKEPAVIAAVAAAQLLQWREAQDAARIQTTSVAASFRPRRISGERG